MPQITIEGKEYDCTPLGPADRLDWHLYLRTTCQAEFYENLYDSIKGLPTALQIVIVRKHSPPDPLEPSMPLYYQLASRVEAVRYLASMVIEGEVEITEENATEYLMSIKQFIKNEEVVADNKVLLDELKKSIEKQNAEMDAVPPAARDAVSDDPRTDNLGGETDAS